MDALSAGLVQGLQILYLTTILPTGGEDNFVRGLRALPKVASVEVINAAASPPDYSLLRRYPHVVVGGGDRFAEPEALGNRLADYVDAGGHLCLLLAPRRSPAADGALSGRVARPEYLPMAQTGGHGEGTLLAFADHPIAAGVHMLYTNFLMPVSSIQGEGKPLGRYTRPGAKETFLAGAYHPHKAVVAVNAFPGDTGWMGDLPLLVANALAHSPASGPAAGPPALAHSVPDPALNP